ncbi:MAG: DUF3999 family protein [Bacteroidota bacterium]
MRSNCSLFFFLLMMIAANVSAQHFRYECTLPVTDSSAYYQVNLTPEINGKFKEDGADFRIYNEGNEVPYIIKSNTPVYSMQQFRNHEIVSKQYLKDSLTLIVVKPAFTRSIHQLVMVIHKADVQKEISISGSNDNQQWFVVKEREIVIPVSNDTATTSQLPVEFPPADYNYYRIEINDHHSKPVNVDQVGYYFSDIKSGAYQQVKAKCIVTDSSKTKSTWITIRTNETVSVDDIEVEIKSPAFYKRTVNVYTLMDNHLIPAGTYEWKAESPQHVHVNLRSDNFYLQILNEDNPPLKTGVINCFQYERHAIAFFEKGKTYSLQFGDSLLESPVYDIAYFQSTIPQELPVLIPGDVKEIKTTAATVAPPSFFSSKKILWVVIIIVVSFLGFVTRRMMKNM